MGRKDDVLLIGMYEWGEIVVVGVDLIAEALGESVLAVGQPRRVKIVMSVELEFEVERFFSRD